MGGNYICRKAIACHCTGFIVLLPDVILWPLCKMNVMFVIT